MFHRIKIFVHLIFVVDLPHENILPMKISRITVCSSISGSACAVQNGRNCSAVSLHVQFSACSVRIYVFFGTLVVFFIVATEPCNGN